MRFPSDFCTFVLQPYSSWSCSPAELHYASDCGAKVQTIIQSAMKTAGNVILQFELLSTYYSKISCKMSYMPKNQDARTRARKLFEIQSNGVEPHNSTIRAIFEIFKIFVICEICVTLLISMW